MEENEMKKVSKYEAEMGFALAERTIKRLFIALILAIIAIVGTNVAWLVYISQYEVESYAVDISSDGGGNANYIGNYGDIINGENSSKKNNP